MAMDQSDSSILSRYNIIVVNSTNKIATYSQDRKFIRSSAISTHNGYYVEKPGGLAIDSAENDQVYVVGSNLKRKELVLLKLKSDLTLIKQVRLVNQESEIYGLEVLDEQLMICKANKSISVHTKDLDHVQELSLSYIPRDIFSDRQGTLYVSTSSFIAVLKNDGTVLRSFGQDILSEAWGVHGAGGYIYVANKRGVSVFTTEGKYVTSFMDNRTFSPRGLCLDKDGFVYICDFGYISIY